MRTIGLIGGMSWESTATYYRLINEGIRERLGGLHSAELLLDSVDFWDIERLQRTGGWEAAGAVLAERAARLERAGAEFLVLCTNTMHKVAPAIDAATSIPLLHIADATGAAIRDAGLQTVGLLGTRFTMEEEFYRGRLADRYDLEVLTPAADERETIDAVIFDELCLGKVLDDSRGQYLLVIERLIERGAEAVILGCTEIAMLVGPEHTGARLFDTTAIHAARAVEWALQGER